MLPVLPSPFASRARLLPGAGFLLSVLTLVVAVPASRALDVADIRCLCADGALSRGDRTACTARLTQRLVDAGALSSEERVNLIHEASRAAWPPDLAAACPGAAGGPWGVGVQTDREVYRVRDTARVEGLLFNFTPADVTGVGSGDGSLNGSDTCLFDVSVRQPGGNAVHRRSLPCLSAITAYPVESGRVRRLLVDVALEHRSSMTGVPDGVPLAAGVYIVRVEVRASYPDSPASPGGLRPFAEIAIQVEN